MIKINKKILIYLTVFFLFSVVTIAAGTELRIAEWPSLYMYYRFNGSWTEQISLKGLSWTLTPNGNANVSVVHSAVYGNASGYDGAGDDDFGQTTANDGAINIAYTNQTISFWINLKDTATNYGIFLADSSNSFATEQEIGAVMEDDGELRVFDNGLYEVCNDPRCDFDNLLNKWVHVAVVYDSKNSLLLYYINGTNVENDTEAIAAVGWDCLRVGHEVTAFRESLNGYLDELAFFNTSLSAQNISYIYQGEAPPPPPPIVTINISDTTPYNFFNSSSSALNLWLLANITYNTNATLYINNTINESLNFSDTGDNINMSFSKIFNDGYYSYFIKVYDNNTIKNSSTKYFNIDTAAPVITSNINNSNVKNYTNFKATFTDQLPLNFTIKDSCNYSFSQAFNGSNKINFTINYSTSNVSCSFGQYHTNITSCDLLNQCSNSLNLNWNITGILNISVFQALNNSAPILNFSVIINGTYLGNTTTGIFLLNTTEQTTFNITISALGYELKSQLVNITSVLQHKSIYLYTFNSISIYIRDENTGLSIYKNVSIKFTSVLGEFTNYTNTSYFYIDNLIANEYTLTFSAQDYNPRNYIVTVGNFSHQTLTAYLVANASYVIFTIMDDDTPDILLANVSTTMYRTINGSWAAVESQYSDITGRVQFQYSPNTNYKFYLSKSDYNDYVFYLSPIYFSEYDIRMTKSIQINYSQDFDGIGLIYAPGIFENNHNTSFNFIFSSPLGTLIDYGFTLTYPGGSSFDNGTNAIGEQLTAWVNISGANIFDTVELEYYYTTTLAGTRTFRVYLPISFINGTGNFSFISNKDLTYGLGIFERVLIATIIILIVVGISTMVGQSVAGLAMGLFVYGYIVYIGFIPLWSILPSMFIGLLFLMWKGGT